MRSKGDVIEDETNRSVMMDDSYKCKLCLPVEEGEESTSLRVLPSPTPPSRQEMLEHNLTHWPFRSWCRHCVAGKAKAAGHRSSGSTGNSEVPVVSMDYAFMGDKEVDTSEGHENLGDNMVEMNETDSTLCKILIARDSRSRVCAAIPVPRKGADVEDWNLKESLRFLEFLGYSNVVLKSDQERAMGALIKKIRTHRGDQTQTMQENSPVGDSRSNGMIERTIQTVQGQIRTMRSALEARLGVKVLPTSPAFAWLVSHAANIITLCEVGKDGRVPYQRLRGRKMQPELVEYGECVMCLPLKHLEMGKAEARWIPGVFIGMKMNSGEKLIATETGIIKVRTIRRQLEAERWNVEQHQWINKFPWRPYSNSNEDEVHIRPPQPVTPEADNGERMQHQRDGDPVPRPFSITRKDLINYGYTPGCPGCQAAANDFRYKPHTIACRKRVEEAMLADDLGSNRVKDAKAREDAYLEQAVRAADEASGRIRDQPATDHSIQPNLHEVPVDDSVPANNAPKPMRWDEMLEENDFHDIVNDDTEMYDAIEALPMDSEDLADQVINVVQNHVSEMWSPPRVTKLAHRFGLSAGFAYDLTVNDENGNPWNFDLQEQRDKCMRHVIEQRPNFLIGSPMCTAFSILQGLNKWRMNPKKWDAMMEKGLRHMRFAVKLYRLQAEQGRWFLHEHPNSASSWKMPEMQRLMNDLGIQKTVAHMCRYGMQSSDEAGAGKVKKPTGFLTNSDMLADCLSLKCMGGHRHVQLMGGRARACQVYPDKLCRYILKGIKAELVHSGIIKPTNNDMSLNSVEDNDSMEYMTQYVDDMSGKPLRSELVKIARDDEMKKFSEHNVYTKVPIRECVEKTGKQPIGSKWIDINKGDEAEPNYRSRLVAKEIRRGPNEDMFAATPPLEAKKCLFSMVMTNFARNRCEKFHGKNKLLFVDVSRAYFYAPSRRPVFVKLPEEDDEPGMCGRLNVSMYGTQDAAANWEHKYSSHLIDNGFKRGKSSPCVFWNPTTGVRCVVHGDDFTFAGNEEELKKCTKMMENEYVVKVRGLLGPDAKDDKSITILNRCVQWTSDGIQYEADPRHVEILVNELELHKTKALTTPGTKGAHVEEEDDPHLDSSLSTKFRQLIARCNFICQDRPDIQYACKEAARGMANPRRSDWDKMLRIAKYLKGKPRYVILFKQQNDVHCINGWGDSDFAGEVTTRKSTSGGLICLGDHVVKSWSSTQTVVALSTGEAELYALNKAAAQSLGLQSLLTDLGVNMSIRLHTDATTGRAIATRRGLGKVRHIAVNELWLQEQVAEGKVYIHKIKNKFNLADLLTKYLSAQEIAQIMEYMQHTHLEGRSDVAPSLSLIEDPMSCVIVKYHWPIPQ